MKHKRILSKSDVQKGCFGDVFTSKEFLNEFETRCILPDDGIGYPHNGHEEYKVEVFEYIYKKAPMHTKEEFYKKFCRRFPYVCWYNK